MKKLIAILTLIAMIASIACTAAFAEETGLIEMGLSEEEYLDFEKGNFEGVTYDGSIRAKIYVDNSWILFEDTGIVATRTWWKSNPEIIIPELEDADASVMNLNCAFIDPASYDGAATLEGMKEFFDNNGFNYACEICTVNGIRALLFNSEGKSTLGAVYELPEGMLKITIDGITNEDLENEAVTTLCSLTIEE